MRESRPLPRSATLPSLPTTSFSSVTTISFAPEKLPDRDGAISRVDRYSKILPPTSAPAPAPAASSLAGPSRPSGLRNVTLISSMENTSEDVETPLSLPSSHDAPRKARFLHPFSLGGARQGVQKAISSMRPTHTTHSRSLRQKKSASSFGSSSSSTARTTGKSIQMGQKMEIGAPLAVIKATPDQLHEKLLALGLKPDDLPSNVGSSSSSSKGRSGALAADESAEIESFEDGMGEKMKDRRPARSESMSSISTTTSAGTSTMLPPAITTASLEISAKRRGKLPARAKICISTTAATGDTQTVLQDTTPKPKGWYATATLDQIRATLSPIQKEDLIPDTEIPAFLAGLMRDFEVLKGVSAWRSEEAERDIQKMVETHLARVCGDTIMETDEDGEEEAGFKDADENEDGNVDYIWGEFGEPDPRFVDSGWGQEELSSFGVGHRWFLWDDVENVLGGPKCPLTHGGLEEHDEIAVDEAENSASSGKAEEVKQVHEITPVSTQAVTHQSNSRNDEENDGRFADQDEDYDEDARQLIQEEILLREGIL